MKLPGIPASCTTLMRYDADEFDERAWHETIMGSTKEALCTKGILPVSAFIFTRTAPYGSEPAPHLVLLELHEVNEHLKDVFAGLLRKFIYAVRARAVGWSSEMWAPPDGQSDAEARAYKRKLDEYARTNRGSWEGFPGITEHVIVHLETAISMHLATAEITRDVMTLKPALRPWKVREPMKIQVGEARFTGLLREIETVHA